MNSYLVHWSASDVVRRILACPIISTGLYFAKCPRCTERDPEEEWGRCQQSWLKVTRTGAGWRALAEALQARLCVACG